MAKNASSVRRPGRCFSVCSPRRPAAGNGEDAMHHQDNATKKRLHEKHSPLALYKPAVARQGIEQMLYNICLEKYAS